MISVNMGYGHQRAVFPLRGLTSEEGIVNANDYPEIPEKDKNFWESGRKFYEFISAFKRIPLLGGFVFFIFDQFQKIPKFYPKRDLSKPSLQLKQSYSLIKRGWGKHLIEKLKKKPLPLISSFFTPAFMAEFSNYPEDIFCLICDTDISRTWASLKPSLSRIKYFVPTQRAAERLKLYGVKPENIFLTGFPLPLENIGSEKLEILKKDLNCRLLNLDPKSKYRSQYEPLIKSHLEKLPQKTTHPLTIMFAVGGAGAQKEIGIKIVKSLFKKIKDGKVKIILVAGIRKEIKDYFSATLKKLRLEKNKNTEVIFAEDISSYFQKFNRALRSTDILWTKPSELSFYTALGLPIIIAPPVGSQEKFNKQWLLELGSGINQKNPDYTNQWLFDLLNKGFLAEAAMQGFIEGEKLGTFNILKNFS